MAGISDRSSDMWVVGKTTFTESGIRMVDLQGSRSIIKMLKDNWKQFCRSIPPYPGGFYSRGIVTCAGGLKYLTCAWVNIHLLKKYGCSLPIEVWYTGEELTPEVIEALTGMGVVCKNVRDYTTTDIDGTALKPFAILHSAFKEVLYIDADNICTADPAYLFESQEYCNTGTMFWPDIWITGKDNPIWQIVESRDYNSIEQESGQILINKEKCWKELNLCMYFNEQRKYYYAMLLGDKDTFRFAWMALKSAYYMVEKSVAFCGYTNERDNVFFGLSMVQHDTRGNIIFLHRNLLKWDITVPGETIWKEIRHFKEKAKNRTISGKYISTGNAQGFDVIDIQGEIETTDFRQLFGDLEIECLQILKDLRDSPMYGRYLLYAYFSYFKPRYIHNAN